MTRGPFRDSDACSIDDAFCSGLGQQAPRAAGLDSNNKDSMCKPLAQQQHWPQAPAQHG